MAASRIKRRFAFPASGGVLRPVCLSGLRHCRYRPWIWLDDVGMVSISAESYPNSSDRHCDSTRHLRTISLLTQPMVARQCDHVAWHCHLGRLASDVDCPCRICGVHVTGLHTLRGAALARDVWGCLRRLRWEGSQMDLR